MPFQRTFRILEAEPEARSRLALLGAIAVLVAWSAWFFGAHVVVYATSQSARVEVARATHPVDAPVAGRVVTVNVALDQAVVEGDVLVQLDDEAQRLALDEARAKLTGLGPQVDATRAEIAAEERALGDLGNQRNAAVAEAAARARSASVARALAAEEASRVERLKQSGSISDVEAMRARADADQKSAAVSAAQSELAKLAHQFTTEHDDRRTRIASLALNESKLEADLATLKATIATLEHDIERRRVLAPAAGRVGEIGNVRPGAVIKEGERVATIVSKGDLRIVAQYVPAEALGRVHAGQTARVRLEGFPWTEYGEVIAQVSDVAREVRDGLARVELEVVKPAPRIPLQHGLPGTVQIEIERVTPAQLVLRAAGRLVAGSRGPAQPAPSASSASTASGG